MSRSTVVAALDRLRSESLLVSRPGDTISLACAIPACLPAVVEAAALTVEQLAAPTARQGGPSLWVRIRWGDGDTFGQVALRHGVEIVPGSTMSADSAPSRSPVHPVRLRPGPDRALVERLAAAWRAYAPSDRSDQGHLSVVV